MEQSFFNYEAKIMRTKGCIEEECNGQTEGACDTDDIMEPLPQPCTAPPLDLFFVNKKPYLFEPLPSGFYYMQPNTIPNGHTHNIHFKVNS